MLKPAGSERLSTRKLGLARVLLDLPGVVLRAEEAGVLAGPDERALHQEGGQQSRRWGCRRARPDVSRAEA